MDSQDLIKENHDMTMHEGKRPLTREDLLSCVELGKALTSELEPKNLFTRIVQKVSELLPAENWSLLLVDEDTSELYFEVAVDLDVTLLKNVRLKIGEGIAGQAALQQKTLVVDEATDCDYFCSRVDQLSGKKTKSVIAVPLLFAGKSIGVIELVNLKRLEERTLPLLGVIADYAAIAVENMRRYKYIESLAVKDGLTGLYNTRYLYRSLDEMIKNPATRAERLSLIFMDVDNFKKVVDTYGHLKGSKTLQELAKTIKDAVHDKGFAVAYGGDEFVAVLPGAGKAEAIETAMDIREKISSSRYLAGEGHDIRITASFGVASYPEDAGDAEGILALADRAMFEIKVTGKDGIKSS
ncbi:MAG: sensor domain-containing diguanylate cyclase [Desulfobacteraceae bacterium]|jgi:diguanylate cyclase (GGDEF)-like protein|nr:MAG: sensor domain-containing diguanylate cyclase [Desulfobacteraceae bacterium]